MNFNFARNIGFSKVKGLTPSGGRGSYVTDEFVEANGKVEDGYKYGFYGGKTAQRNTGSNWITSYNNGLKANASRIRVIDYDENRIFIFWEEWNNVAYGKTMGMLLDKTGKKLTEPVEIGRGIDVLRIGRRDEPIVINGKIYFVMGDNEKFEMKFVEFNPVNKG